MRKVNPFRDFSRFFCGKAARRPPEAIINSAAAELRPGHRRRCGRVLMAEIDSTLGQIIGRHFDCDPVAGKNTDAVLLHLAGGVGKRFMPVVEPYAKPGIGQQLGHGTFEFDQIFLSQ